MSDAMSRPAVPTPDTASKVPEVTLVFWIIKIAATTLGETGGDTVTMTGYKAKDATYTAAGREITFPDGTKKFAGPAGR